MLPRLWFFPLLLVSAIALLSAPVLAEHHVFHITNNASQRIAVLTMVYHLPDGSTLQRAYNVKIPLRVIKDITIPHSVVGTSGPVDTSEVCTIDLAIGYANGTSVWLTGRDLCAQKNVEARDSGAYLYTNAQYATPMPDLTPEPTAVPPTPQPQPTPRTPAQEALHRGEQLFAAGEFNAALPYFNRVIKLDPRNSYAYAYRSRTYFLLDRLQPSLSDADTGLRIDVQYGLLHWIRANTEWASHLNDSAIEDYTVTATSPNVSDVQAYVTVLSVLAARESGDLARSKTLLATCATSCKGGAGSQRLLAYLQGKLTARDLLNAASTKYERADAHAVLGFVLLQRGRKSEAREHFRWILQNAAPTDNWRPIVRVRLGGDGARVPSNGARPKSLARRNRPAVKRAMYCAKEIFNDSNVTGGALISLCQHEISAYVRAWAATGDPAQKGDEQLAIGDDYWSIAYYCEYYRADRKRHVAGRCALGTAKDLAAASLRAAEQAYTRAKRDSNNAAAVVMRANNGLEDSRKLARKYNLALKGGG